MSQHEHSRAPRPSYRVDAHEGSPWQESWREVLTA